MTIWVLEGEEKREGTGFNFSSIVCKDTQRIDSDFKTDESEFSLSKLGHADTKALENGKISWPGAFHEHKCIRVNYQGMPVESLKFQWYHEKSYIGKPHNNLVVKKNLEKCKLYKIGRNHTNLLSFKLWKTASNPHCPEFAVLSWIHYFILLILCSYIYHNGDNYTSRMAMGIIK